MDRKEEKERYKKKIKEITSQKDIVPGIHNYCDRWCERCTFTRRCAVFLSEKEMGWDDHPDSDNKEFWERMSMIYEGAVDLLYESAKSFGIDLDQLDEVELSEPVETDLEKLAKTYSLKTMDWLKKNEDYLVIKINDASLISNEKLVSMADAIEVIKWYSIFISAKTHRALNGYTLDDEDFLYDSKGSAKIAIIAITRTIKAFTFLYLYLHEKEDQLLDFLNHLSKIKKGLFTVFPDVMEFKRPGFDD